MKSENIKIDISKYQNSMSRSNQIKRIIWNLVWMLFARPLPRSLGNKWKLILLRLFGAKVNKTAVVYSTVKIYQPWNLEMKEYSCLAPDVDCYNVGKIIIGAHATVSQKSYLCAASHNIQSVNHELISSPIVIENQAWIGADAFIGMGVTVGEGAVVGARAAVFKNVEPWTIVGGNPSRFIKKRELTNV
ncbi:putative colanic acid biosynthesis acetyltransferase [uncultured Sphingobacterium sp.]|uniref:putative colanic acid biosynthesis acetyltransferase n=1 Tax=uncultured Sphingobacterium sp. TaxID=182688 RepID=UPI0025F1B18B|nr:putative colanic acid biosynthesis acetyltransferase [uncultured Sphingobacterium sp.]